MDKYKYRITVRIGSHEFHHDFEHEQPALDCFQSIASTPDVEIDGDGATVPSEASVVDVTIRRYPVPVMIGNPNRR